MARNVIGARATKKTTPPAPKLALTSPDFRQDLKMMNPGEIGDMRRSLMRVQGAGDSFGSVRAMRLIGLLDWYEQAQAERVALEAVIKGAGDVTTAVEDFTDEIGEVLKKDHAGNLADIFQDHDPAGDPKILEKAIAAYVEKAMKEARESVDAQVKILTTAVETHVKKLKELSDVKEE
jgi:hypothetical protein